jgi:predicted ATPase/DNA-binding CsgD family transcriptional regulator
MSLLEREDAVAALVQHQRAAELGPGRRVLVEGEAGIGKTSLLRAFAAQPRKGAGVHWGACDALQTPRPLAPLHDLAERGSLELAALLEAGAPRLRIFRAFLDWLSRRPVVVIFEDLHWADEATLDLVRYVGRRVSDTRSLIIGTLRNEEVGPTHPLQLVLGDLATCASPRLTLQRLSLDAVRVMAGDRADQAETLHRVTGGNPFYVTEALAARNDGVPPTVRDAVLARAGRLGPSARATLDAAAVAGPRIEPWLLQDLVAAEAEAVQQCVESGVLIGYDGLLWFRHELARQAVLEAMTPSRRMALHRLALQALRAPRLGAADPARLAHHAEAAGDGAALLEFASIAAQEAAAKGAHRQAAEQWERALRAGVTGVRERARMLDAYATECHLGGRVRNAIEARGAAVRLWQDLGAQDEEAASLAQLARSYVIDGRNAEAEATLLRALALIQAGGESPAAVVVRTTSAYLRMLDRDSLEAVAEAGQALAIAERLDDRVSVARCLDAMGSAQIVAGQVEEGVSHLERGLQLALDLGVDDAAAGALGNLGSGCGEQFRFDLAEDYLRRGIAYCIERDLDHARNYQTAWLALVLMYRGRWTESTAAAHRVIEDARASPISRTMALIALGRVRARRGDPGVWDLLDEARDLAARTATLQRVAPVLCARAEAAWLEGRIQDATTEATRGVELALRKRHGWFAAELMFWQVRGGADAPVELADAYVAENPFALEAVGRWVDAAAGWRERGCPYETARALATGDEASQRSALELLTSLGANPLADRVRRQLRLAGARGVRRGPRPASKVNPAGLTGKELEVLELLGAGLRNREIAQRLNRSVRTVDHHVASIFTKVGARTRAEVVGAAYRMGLVREKEIETGSGPGETPGH